MKRKFAIGDIHGCLSSLITLLNSIKPQKKDTVVMLGDYVDRGPDSKGVIDYLINWPWPAKLVTLKGNHEYIMEDACLSRDHLTYWCRVGGFETLESYGGDFHAIPNSHWSFIARALPYYETKKAIYVHGGLYPHLPMEEQDPDQLAWLRFTDAQPHFSGKFVVCGHTIQRNGFPSEKTQNICIDTGAFRPKGWLTCLELKSRHFWQANEKGQTREGKLRDLRQKSPPKKVKTSLSPES